MKGGIKIYVNNHACLAVIKVGSTLKKRWKLLSVIVFKRV